ncbi:MAG: peroxiredoxin [Actinomycetota bacterium]|jgi:peroxiredoxin|nr:peroxiredoxin [Actinomycetota bacterium]
MVEIGQAAPDFTLRDTNKVEHTLSEKQGSPVLLVFYPFSFTGVCEGELCRIRDDYSQFESAGVQVLAISCDPSPSQAKWAGEQGWQFPVLSDFWPHGAVAQAYGIFNEKVGCAMRGTFLIGADGVVVDAFATEELGQARPAERYDEALAKL